MRAPNRGPLPASWMYSELGGLGNWSGGGTPSKDRPEFWTGGIIPWISPKDMKTATITGGEDHITQEAVASSAAKIIPPGSILIVTRSGILSHTVPVSITSVPVTVNQDLKALVPHNCIDPNYIAYALKAFEHDILNTCTKHGTTVASIETPTLYAYEIPVAPYPEQRRIVAALESHLSRLDDAVAALERVKRTLARYRASVLHAAVTGRLVPTEAEIARAEGREYEPASALLARILGERRRRWEEAELAKLTAAGKAPKDDRWKARYVEPVAPDTERLGELPEGWCWATVDQLLTDGLSNGRSVPTAGHGCPVLRLTALKGDTIDLKEHKIGAWTIKEATPFLVRLGDFLVSRGNGSIRLVGRGGLVERHSNSPIAFPDTLIRVRIPAHVFLPRLLAILWNSAAVRTQIEPRAKTTAGIWKVNQTDLENIVLPVPPIAEQTRLTDEIVRQNSVIDACQDTLQRSSTRLTRLRQSILRLAFEGRLVDQDPADEPAAVLLDRIRAERAARSVGGARKGRRKAGAGQERLL